MSDQYCSLIHIPAELGKFLNTLYRGGFSQRYKANHFDQDQFLYAVRLFIKKINSCDQKTYISFSESNEFLDILHKEIKKSDLIPYEHELFLAKSIFREEKNINFILYFNSIFPLWDTEITEKMVRNHVLYSADYSYGENLPAGISPSILGRSLIEIFEIEHEGIFEQKKISIPLNTYIEKNINDFHVEIYYEEPDLRILRLDFSGRDLRSILKTNKMLHKISQEKPLYPQLNANIEQHPDILYAIPSYLEVELVQDCEYECIFCPRQYLELKPEIIHENVLNEIEAYLNQSMGDTSICFGGLGEPLQHISIKSIIERFLANENLRFLIVETNGYYLEKIFQLSESPYLDKFKLVVNINGFKNYGTLHGVDPGYAEKVKQNLITFSKKLKQKDNHHLQLIYLQTLKIHEVEEEEVDAMDQFAEDLGVNFLLQKYNSYIGLMPERRVSDMTPLDRFPCWHLRRDLFIHANGDVAFCKQDIKNRHVSGNLNQTNIAHIWNLRQEAWEKHFHGNYSTNPDCRTCDEYFTFNL